VDKEILILMKIFFL